MSKIASLLKIIESHTIASSEISRRFFKIGNAGNKWLWRQPCSTPDAELQQLKNTEVNVRKLFPLFSEGLTHIIYGDSTDKLKKKCCPINLSPLKIRSEINFPKHYLSNFNNYVYVDMYLEQLNIAVELIDIVTQNVFFKLWCIAW